MGAESIDKIVSKEAIQQLLDLGKQLEELEGTFEDLILTVDKYSKELNKATGYRDVANGINNLNDATGKLHSTNVKVLDIEREIKSNSEKMVKVIKNEAELWDKVDSALIKVTKDILA